MVRALLADSGLETIALGGHLDLGADDAVDAFKHASKDAKDAWYCRF